MSTATMPTPTAEAELAELETSLKPCPFCGGRAKLRLVTVPESPEGGFAVAACDLNNDCTVHPSAGGETPAEAVQNWNQRRN